MLHQTKLKFKEKLQFRAEHVTKYIVIHHSEVSTPHTVEDIHRWHQKRGWAGIGYHYFINKNGEIYEGRPFNIVGAHAKDHNAESIGVCFEGNFNKEKMKEKQLNASIMLLSLLSLANNDATICGHSQLAKEKTCPGKNFPLDRLITKVNECKVYLNGMYGEQLNKDFYYKPKTVIRISQCCMAVRNPLAFPILKGTIVVFSMTLPSIGCACLSSFPDMREWKSVHIGLS